MKDDSHILIGTRIEFDKEKIEKEGRYIYPALIKRLDYIAEHFGLEVLESGHLYGNKKDMMYHDSDMAMTLTMSYLTKCRWFMENIKTWEASYSYMNGEDRNWEDLLISIRKLKLMEVTKYVE